MTKRKERIPGPLTREERTELCMGYYDYLESWVLRWTSGKLRGHDLEDCLQYIRLFLWRQSRYFDPARSSQNTFRVNMWRYGFSVWVRERKPCGYRTPGSQFDFQTLSLDWSDGESDASGIEPAAPAEEEGSEIDRKEMLKRLLGTLPERDRQVLEWKILEGQTLRGIAARLGVSKERVRQIVNRSIGRLRPLAEAIYEGSQ